MDSGQELLEQNIYKIVVLPCVLTGFWKHTQRTTMALGDTKSFLGKIRSQVPPLAGMGENFRSKYFLRS